MNIRDIFYTSGSRSTDKLAILALIAEQFMLNNPIIKPKRVELKWERISDAAVPNVTIEF